MRCLAQNDCRFSIVGQVVQGGDDRPAVHLRLVDLLHTVVEAGCVTKADCVGCGEQAEGWVRGDDLVLVKKG